MADIGFYLSMAKEVGLIFQGENALKNRYNYYY